MTDASDDDPAAAEAARLRERLEQGALPRERLTLARALGHAPSRLALGRPTPPDDALDDAPSLEFWGRRLGRWGPPVMLRAAAALARHLTGATAPPEPVASVLEDALRVVDRFLLPAAQRGAADEPLPAAVDRAATATARAALTLDPEAPGRRACQTLLPLLRAIQDLLRGGAPDRRQLDQHYLRALEQAQASGAPLADLQAAVRAELLRWALEAS